MAYFALETIFPDKFFFMNCLWYQETHIFCSDEKESSEDAKSKLWGLNDQLLTSLLVKNYNADYTEWTRSYNYHDNTKTQAILL